MAYFDSGARPSDPNLRGAIVTHGEQPQVTPAPGVTFHVVAGSRLLVAWVAVEPHSEVPVHSHDEEQMGTVVSGWVDFELDGEVTRVFPGDVYHAPPGVPHGARTGDEPCTVIDVYSPPRAALLALLRDQPR
jgi:quercetin dioxygenase-like cupin family protein